jgi:hypothetical protein
MNFDRSKADILMILTIMDQGHSFCENKPIEPVTESDNDTTLALQKADYENLRPSGRELTRWHS